MTATDAMKQATSGQAPGATATVEDPTAGGKLCGARRSDGQIRQAVEAGEPNPWPWCRLKAGWGTDHSGAGSCKLHAGSTPNGRRSAQLRLEELRNPAIVALAKVLTGKDASPQAVLRAVENVLDRTGHPRRTEVDVEAAREGLVDRIQRAMMEPEAEN